MTKGELRRQRKQARSLGLPYRRINTHPRDPMDDADRGTGPVEFSESPRGYIARDRWARWYDELNGAPDGPDDY